MQTAVWIGVVAGDSTVTNGNKRYGGAFSRLALLRTHPYNSVPFRTGRMSSVSEVQVCSGWVAAYKPEERLLALVRIVAVYQPAQ